MLITGLCRTNDYQTISHWAKSKFVCYKPCQTFKLIVQGMGHGYMCFFVQLAQCTGRGMQYVHSWKHRHLFHNFFFISGMEKNL